jgi:hypothetical protein
MAFFMDDIITHLKFFKFTVMTMIVFFWGIYIYLRKQLLSPLKI